MPAHERRKFAQLLRGRRPCSLPGDDLPPVTVDNPPRKTRRRRVEALIRDLKQPRLL